MFLWTRLLRHRDDDLPSGVFFFVMPERLGSLIEGITLIDHRDNFAGF